MDDADHDVTLDQLFAEAIGTATQAAYDAVTPHVAETGRVRFPLDGELVRLSDHAPQAVKNAAAFLLAMLQFARCGADGDLDGATKAAFLAGALSAEAWLAAAKGQSFADVVESLGRRKNGGAATRKVTPELQAIAQESVNAKCRGNSSTSFTAACKRAAAELVRDGRVKSLSGKALSEYLEDPTLGNR